MPSFREKKKTKQKKLTPKRDTHNEERLKLTSHSLQRKEKENDRHRQTDGWIEKEKTHLRHKYKDKINIDHMVLQLRHGQLVT